MTFAADTLEYAELGDGAWGSVRLVVGGKDVTYFRDVPATIGGYQLTEPYSYGPADFGLPSLTQFEVDDWGTGDLRWMGNGKPVQLKQVDADGHTVRTIWRGFITTTEVTTTGVLIHCDGEASGRLAMRIKTPDLFSVKQHVGRKIFDAFAAIHTPLTPYLGGDQGVQTDARGASGSLLGYVDSLLAATIDTDGSQLTIWRRESGDYHLGAKDTTTVDFTAFLGAHGVDVDVQDDLTERPNAIYGQGVAPNGLVWSNGKFPGLIQGDAPDYPMTDSSAFSAGTTDADTDTGDGVTVMIAKLTGMGYLDRTDKPGGYDSDATAAIKDLQDDAGLTVSGNMNVATWRALFDLDATGLSLRGARSYPLAQDPKVKRYRRTSNGSVLGKNPHFDPSVPQVDLWVDHGVSVEKSRARRWSQGVLARAQNAKNWAGTMTLSADVFAGAYHHTDGDPTLMSRLDITAGMNFDLRYFDGGTRFHVSIVNVAPDLTVTLGIDTQARDAATLAEVIARRIESRSNPARQWRQQRRTDANTRLVEFSEVGGQVFNTVACAGDDWTVFPVVAGQAGTVSRVRIQTSSDEAAFVVAIFGKKVGPGWLRKTVGNPFDSNAHGESKWTNVGVQKYLDNQRVLLGVWGDDAEPCGYLPRSHQKPDGSGVSDAPVTGLFLDDGGFDYHTFGAPVLYVAVYADRDTKIKPQRILWDTLEALD